MAILKTIDLPVTEFKIHYVIFNYFNFKLMCLFTELVQRIQTEAGLQNTNGVLTQPVTVDSSGKLGHPKVVVVILSMPVLRF